MQVQLAVMNDVPEESKFNPVKNQSYDHNMKPEGCFWTSSWIEEEKRSDWVRWCLSEDFEDSYAHPWYLLSVRPDARIYHIDSQIDLWELWTKYQRFDLPRHNPFHTHWIDWEKVAQDYDGVHLTEKGNAECHWGDPIDLNCWDVESTVWFRWVFESVEEITVVVDGTMPKLLAEVAES